MRGPPRAGRGSGVGYSRPGQFRLIRRRYGEYLHQRPKLERRVTLRQLTTHELHAEYAKLAVIVAPAVLPAQVSVDPDDDAVLACAIAAQADAIVTGDDHLLRLKVYQGIPILTATELLARIASM